MIATIYIHNYANNILNTISIIHIYITISMLTSESNLSESTSTEILENKLINMLTPAQPKNQLQLGGNNISSDDLKQYFHTLKSNGVKVDIKLNDKSLSEFFNLAQNTTTEINNNNNNDELKKNEYINDLLNSQTSEYMTNNENNINTTTSSSNFLMEGGAKKSKSNSDKPKKIPSEGFLAFGKLKDHIAEKLKIPRSKIAMQIASAVLKDIKSKHDNIDTISAVEKSIELFDKKKDYYYDMFKK